MTTKCEFRYLLLSNSDKSPNVVVAVVAVVAADAFVVER